MFNLMLNRTFYAPLYYFSLVSDHWFGEGLGEAFNQ